MFETLHIDRGNALIRASNVLVQVRTGGMTVMALEAMLEAARRMHQQVGGRGGALVVLSERAEMLPPMLRKRQQQGLKALIQDPAVSVCIVIEGSSAGAKLFRTLAQADGKMARNGAVHADVHAGAQWLAESIGNVDAAFIEEAAAHARALANKAG